MDEPGGFTPEYPLENWRKPTSHFGSSCTPDYVSEFLFLQSAITLGVLATYYRSGGRDRELGNTLGYNPVTSNLALQLCFSLWLTDHILFNPSLAYRRDVIRQRPNQDDYFLTGNSLYSVVLGAAYFNRCFGNFGMLAGVDMAFGFGNNVNKSKLGSTEIKNTNSLWQMGPSGYLGVWYAVNRYLISAQLGVISYLYTSAKVTSEFGGDFRQNTSVFQFGLDTKQFALGLRYLLNRKGSTADAP